MESKLHSLRFARPVQTFSTWAFGFFLLVFSRGLFYLTVVCSFRTFIYCVLCLYFLWMISFWDFYGVMWLPCKCFHCWIFTLLVKILWFDTFLIVFFPFLCWRVMISSCEPGVLSLSSSWFSYENHLSRFRYVRDWRAIIFDGTSSWLSFSWPFLATWFRIVIWFGSPVSELGELFIGSVVLTEPF